MKLLLLLWPILNLTPSFAQSWIKVQATMTLNTGTFVATSKEIRGRLLKVGEEFKADRISVYVNSFKTENAFRDKHFAEYVGGGEKLPHPRVDILRLTGKNNKARADLKINGVTKPVSINYEVDGKYVEAEFDVNTEDFNLPKAQYLGIGVEKVVKVTARYRFEKK